MYIPHPYKNENIDEIKSFLADNGFAILINQIDGKPWATHIPLELDIDEKGKDILVGHIAKSNPQWKAFANHPNVMAIFNGPHCYVSSSWYQEEEVPTWNYIAVHVYGTIKIISEQALLESLHKLVDKYERESKNPISLTTLTKKTMQQTSGIVGFHIQINEIQAAYKLSQTRGADHPSIINELEKTGNPGAKEIARLMKKE